MLVAFDFNTHHPSHTHPNTHTNTLPPTYTPTLPPPTHTQSDLAAQHRAYTAAVYQGQVDNAGTVPEKLKAPGPSEDEYLWYSALV